MTSTRRTFLASSALAAGSGLLAGCAAQGKGGPSGGGRWPIIDAHTHFYDPHRPQGTPPEFPPKGDPVLYRTILPANFRAVAGPCGVHHTIVVEASPWPQDNDWILELAKVDPTIVGLVGNLLPGEEAFAGHLKRLAMNPLFRGLRLRRNGGGEVTRGLNDPAFLRDLKLLADHDLELDVGHWSATLPEIAKLAGEFPSLRLVINHIAGVKVEGKPPPAEFVADLRRVAARPNIWCKISALAEQTGQRNGSAPRDTAYYAPTIDAFWETFGEDRLIYGSNWPVCEWSAPYDAVFKVVDEYFTGKGAAAREKYFSRNAMAAYKWVRR